MDIKVRVWDKVGEKYVVLGSCHDHFYLDENNVLRYGNYQNGGAGAEYEIELFSDTTDIKNSVICQGDILTPTKFPEDDQRFVVVIFEKGAFRKKSKQWPDGLPCPTLNKPDVDLLDYVIAGNIRENPELWK